MNQILSKIQIPQNMASKKQDIDLWVKSHNLIRQFQS